MKNGPYAKISTHEKLKSHHEKILNCIYQHIYRLGN